MAIIGADMHGDPDAARAFLAYRKGTRRAVVGDLVDSRLKGTTLKKELECLDLLLTSDAELFWGNHDLSYLPLAPWECFGNFGVSAFREQFTQHRTRLQAASSVDGWLLTHAGVGRALAHYIPEDVKAAGADHIANWINKEFARQLQVPDPRIIRGEPRMGYGVLFNRAFCRGGEHGFGGIFWFDAYGEQSQPAAICPQIFGHSAVPCPERGETIPLSPTEKVCPWINLNAYQDEGYWIYDTETDEIVRIF